MKKIILILLLIAALAVAWLYLKPVDVSVDKRATVSDVASEKQNTIEKSEIDVDGNPLPDANGLPGEVEENAGEVEPFVPEKPLAEIEDAQSGTDVETSPTHALVPNSKVNRRGTKVGGEHSGELNVKQGSITVESGKIVGGSFVMDMTSIKATDIDSPKLDEHIQEWFNVENHPEATFVLSDVSGTKVSGVMTINGISKSITFPATVVVEDDNVIARAGFGLDRNEWDVAGGTPAVSEFMEISFVLLWTKE